MKKLLLSSLILATAAVNLSAASTANVTAKINVIDPTKKVSINVSSSSATFGDIMIATGKQNLKEKIILTLEGTQTKKATIDIPKELKLTTGTGAGAPEIIAKISIEKNSGDFTETVDATNFKLESIANMDTKSSGLSAKIGAILDLKGTEAAGNYNGSLVLTAKYK